ncbi:MAG: signal peptidase II [Mycobacterium sp.]|nr:signal peptidase II [Mycobacterium sp.]
MSEESTEPQATASTVPETTTNTEPESTASPESAQRAADDTAGSSEAALAQSAAPLHRRLRLLLVVAAVVLGLDVVTKVLAVNLLVPGQPVEIIGDTVTWTLVRNSGAAFSMATSYTWVLTLIATGVVLGIVWMGRRLVSPWWALGLGMILGGALGNLMDRFFRSPGPLRGHVVDFLSVGWWPVFNIADSAVVCGAALLVGLSVFGFDFDTDGRNRPDNATDTTERVGAQPDSATTASGEAESGR